MTIQDGIRAVLNAFGGAATPPRWPMYVRQAKQYLHNAVDGFDEKHYGFASVVDLLRAAGKEGVLRVERDRQGAVRVFAGPKLTALSSARPVDAAAVDTGEAESVAAVPAPELPVVDAEAVAEAGAVSTAPRKRTRRRKSVKAKSAKPADTAPKTPVSTAPTAPAGTSPKSAKAIDAASKVAKPTDPAQKAAKPRKPRARRTVRAKPVSADVRD